MRGVVADVKTGIRNAGVIIGVALALLAAGYLLPPLATPAWETLRRKQPEARLQAVDEGLGSGLTLALLGGFRALAADLIFLRAYTAWEDRDLALTPVLLRLAVATDPRAEAFWERAAYITALDMPHWERRAREAAGEAVTDAEWQALRRRYLARGLTFLHRAQQAHPRNHRFPLARARLLLAVTQDRDAAFAALRAAVACPDVPLAVVRFYADQLRADGRLREAYKFLHTYYRTTDASDPDAQLAYVADILSDLEEALGIAGD